MGKAAFSKSSSPGAAFALTAALALLPLPGVATADPVSPRYSLAGGCYSLATADDQPIATASQLRFQTTDLGSYLLYGTGAVALVASTAPGNELLGVGTGDTAADLRGTATRVGSGVWTADLGSSAAVYLVRDGRVRVVAVADEALAGGPAELRAYLDRVPAHGVTRRPSEVVNAESADLSPKEATPLVAKDGSGGAQFPLFCGL
jgi:hypothetical protein